MSNENATPESTEETAAPATVALPEKVQTALDVLTASPLYGAVAPMLTEKFSGHYQLVKVNNDNVAAINEAKDTDPNSTEYQDSTWKRAVADELDPELVKKEKRYQTALATAEKLLAELREGSKAHMRPALSEEEVTKLRKTVNEGKKVIEDSVKANASVAEMADQMLTLAGSPVEGGIWSLMPQPESLMNKRAKGSAGKSAGEGYATRLVEAFINGETANRNVKRKGVEVFAAHFNYVAEDLSKEFGDKEFPGNQVTAEEVEKAYYDSKGVEFRDSENMPADHEFQFVKEIETRNGADGTVKKVPVSKAIRVVRWTKETKGKEGEIATEESADASAEEAKPESADAPAEAASA